MQKTVLVVHAHPEPTSLTRTLVETAKTRLSQSGHRVIESDLYGLNWKSVFDADDFPRRENENRLSFIAESGFAYANGTQTPDVLDEQAKLCQADAVIFHFPLWWFSFPAILKGWVDRVFAFGLAYGYKGAGNQYRYGEGGFAGKRALLSVTVGGPRDDYGGRGINGSLEQILFPITHGTLFFSGMEVLPTFAVYDSVRMTDARAELAKEAWKERINGLFTDAPIPFRFQNNGDYPDRHQLAKDVAPGLSGILAHLKDPDGFI
jgi:NAD(P)H dehydrogenase (quinone)